MENQLPVNKQQLDLKLIFISVIACFVYIIGASYALEYFNINTGGSAPPPEKLQFILYFVLLNPLLGTLIVQRFVYSILLFAYGQSAYFKHIYIIISAVLYALLSSGNTVAIALLYLPGIVLSFSYYKAKMENRPAFWTTFSIQALLNLAIGFFDYYMAA
ncbi:hypothetical protein LX64_01510 [Chitinophaga skermanii]|uniref:Uncharacterized protein n=1 Tax=Chitinophaga skermanii TaxID=331697 RepID=A0A327QW08_9BACT|nr:hypothetical protein [Chitinophaga skermanii]RAJ08856.1 hypothetical protein LX64_01510 [Chitinophaga skermanii]